MDSNLPPVIGVCGAIGSGKDSVAQFLHDKWGYRRIGLADELKETCARVFPHIPRKHFFGTQEDKRAPLTAYGLPSLTGRKILEQVGEALRQLMPDVWLNFVATTIDMAQHAASLTGGSVRFVIPDVRHRNEFDVIQQRFQGVVWRVVRVGGHQAETTGHISDRAQERFPVDANLVARTGDMDSLREQVVSIARGGGVVAAELEGLKL